ncbi:MAG: alkaline phosphatase family protein [Clostridiales bacterium]|nr:alkaline phosphatase family protein [Clostridiales bacterium]
MINFEKIYNMVDIAPTVCSIMNIREPLESVGDVIKEIKDDLNKYNKVCLLVMDAFGYDIYTKWKHVMPYLASLHDKNSIVVSSVMPTITPVNFSTMITGTTLKVHGGENLNSILKCETIFDVLHENKKSSAGVGRKEYTGANLLARYSKIPTIYPDPSKDIKWDDGFYNTMIDLLEKSPDYIIAQLGTIDTVFHAVGPSSKKVIPMLIKTDEMLSNIIPILNKLGYGIILLADHGQQDKLDGSGGTHGSAHYKERLVPCTWC